MKVGKFLFATALTVVLLLMGQSAFAQSNNFVLGSGAIGSVQPTRIPPPQGALHCGAFSLTLPFTVNPAGNVMDDLKGGPGQSVQVLVGPVGAFCAQGNWDFATEFPGSLLTITETKLVEAARYSSHTNGCGFNPDPRKKHPILFSFRFNRAHGKGTIKVKGVASAPHYFSLPRGTKFSVDVMVTLDANGTGGAPDQSCVTVPMIGKRPF